MEINALAFRQATEEGLSGTALASRIADLRQNPTDEIMQQARAKATDLTLMGPAGKWVDKLSQWVNHPVNLPLLGETPVMKFIDPFIHIAANIMDQALMQRTPIGLFSPEIRADLAGCNGNGAADTAASKMWSARCSGLRSAAWRRRDWRADPDRPTRTRRLCGAWPGTRHIRSASEICGTR